MIPVTKTFLPPRQEYEKYVQQIWKTGWVTNNGELATGLEEKLEDLSWSTTSAIAFKRYHCASNSIKSNGC